MTACGAEKGIEIHSAWMRPTGQGENGAVYFVIHNHSSTADELLGASSDIAEAIEMHQSMTTGEDVMRMHEMATVPLEPFVEMGFAPGGLHFMLVGLKQETRTGDEIEIILHLRNSEDMRVVVPVRETAAPQENH